MLRHVVQRMATVRVRQTGLRSGIQVQERTVQTREIRVRQRTAIPVFGVPQEVHPAAVAQVAHDLHSRVRPRVVQQVGKNSVRKQQNQLSGAYEHRG